MSSSEGQYSHLQVAGEGILPVVKAISAEALAKVLLGKYGLKNVQAGQLYPMESYLALLNEMERRMPTVLKSIGTFIMTEALWPPDITSLEAALSATDVAYYMNHPGAKEGEIGHYLSEKISDKVILMPVSCPYPCVFDQGIILGMAQKFQVLVSVEHADDACRSKGDPQCNYRIEIKS